ncbi:MAG: glycosyltransferase, partial [Planctomycetota bacterium]
DVPDLPNIHNFNPAFATSIPRYDNLDVVLPPLVPMLRHLDKHQPDCIHISTPGPVGLVGYVAAKMLRVPVLGVYHTDFPAYVDHLFEDHAFTSMCRGFMRFFYSPFHSIFTRSDDYVAALERLGLPRERTVSLMPGFDTTVFDRRFRDVDAWSEYPGVMRDSVKALYVGRVSIEKNLPLLTGAWPEARQRAKEAGVDAELIIVGDGPYRKKMEGELKKHGAHFLGFRHGEELSRIYASCDMFVFPSTTDTLGQVVMESQGSALPVLVSDVGGPKEVVRHGETGFVLPGESDQGTAALRGPWTDHIALLLSDHDKRRTMGDAAHAFMQTYSIRNSFEHFWDVHVQAWHEHLVARGIEPKGPEQVHRTRPRADRAEQTEATV